MAQYGISGIWKDSDNVISHYAFHRIDENSTTRAVKTIKAEAIKLLETIGNTATTLVWNYRQSNWNVGEEVDVVKGANGKYLRSDPNDRTTDNLGHLIDFDWILT